MAWAASASVSRPAQLAAECGLGHEKAGEIGLGGLHLGELIGQFRAALGRQLQIEVGRARTGVDVPAEHHFVEVVEELGDPLQALLGGVDAHRELVVALGGLLNHAHLEPGPKHRQRRFTVLRGVFFAESRTATS